MATFWENFAEAMGWGKANHTQHLSDISEDKRNEYRNASAEARKAKSMPLNIRDAKDSGEWATTTGTDFNEQYAGDDYETRVYDFAYAKPSDPNNMDRAGRSAGLAFRNGKVLVRVPKNRTTKQGWGVDYFDESDANNPTGTIGVYEAVLDDGTVLNAKDFEDLVYADPYGDHFKLGKRNKITGADDMDLYRSYKNAYGNNVRTEKTVSWDKNYRRWMAK